MSISRQQGRRSVAGSPRCGLAGVELGWRRAGVGRRSGMSIAVAVESRRGARVREGDADLQALLAGDKAAWDRFVARYAAVIFAAVRRRLVPAGRTANAEDVVQDVFVRLCQHDFRLLRRYDAARARSEEHTSELQSLMRISYA